MNSSDLVTVLFARSDSVYKTLPGTDVYDLERDATTYTGTNPVVAHPPCRGWGRFRLFANPREGEKDLAVFAISQVRKNGGVLEHPSGSSLFAEQDLPGVNQTDEWGVTIQVDQHWYGHKARKRTWLYIVGVSLSDIPPAPLTFSEPGYCIAPGKGNPRQLRHLSKADREHTPPTFAQFLLDLARMSSAPRVLMAHQPMEGARAS